MDRWTPLRQGAGDVIVVPRSALLSSDPATIACLIDDVLGHPEGREVLARWLGMGEVPFEDAELRARAIATLTQGYWRAIELSPAPATSGLAGPKTEPTGPRKPEGPRPKRPTWIAVTVVDDDGLGFARTSWTITTADGEDRSIRLDDDSTWRTDDLAVSGTCYLRVGATMPEPGVPSAAGPKVTSESLWLEAEPRAQVALRTGMAHTVVVVRGRTEIALLDETGRPAPQEWCEVTIGERVHKRLINAQGLLVVWHPRHLESIATSFVLLSADAVVLAGSQPLATEASGA